MRKNCLHLSYYSRYKNIFSFARCFFKLTIVKKLLIIFEIISNEAITRYEQAKYKKEK